MRVFIIGVTGGVGRRLASSLSEQGDEVAGLVRKPGQAADLADIGVEATIGDITMMSASRLAEAVRHADVIVYTAGAGGGGPEATTAIDGDGVVTAIEAAHLAGVSRCVLVSVFPEAWRDRAMGPGFEHYIEVKKQADIALTRSGLDWVILRPAALVDDPARGSVALGPAEVHRQISRADVADTLVHLLHQPRIRQQILELTDGDTPIPDAVAGNVRDA